MTRRFISMLVLLAGMNAFVFASEPASSQGSGPKAFAGTWAGVLEIGPQQLRLELEIGVDNSKPNATLVSVDQGGARIPLDKLSISGNEIEFSAAGPALAYSGALAGNERIEGIFRQGGLEVDLVFQRGDLEAPEPEQSAADPRDRDLVVRSGEVALAGSLRVPEGTGPFPGVVILSGSGPQDRDGNIAGQSLYRALADLLESEGIASLRLDDRGVGQSDAVEPASPGDLAHDAAAALAALQAEGAVECTGFLGHSEGGLIALLAAAKVEPAFVVTLAGMHAPLEEILTRQGAAILDASGASADQMASTRTAQQAVFSAIRKADRPDAVEEIEAALMDAGFEPQAAAGQAAIWGRPYAVALFEVDAALAARGHEGPLLAFFGANDLQVPPEAFAERLASQRGNLPTDIHIIPGVDHLFQESESGLPQDYGSAGHALAPAAADAIGSEIAELASRACKP